MRLILLLCAIAFATTLDAQPTTNYPPFFTNAQGVVTTNVPPPAPPPAAPLADPLAPIKAAWATLVSAVLAYLPIWFAARLARKGLPDASQTGGFGQLLSHLALEINGTPGLVPAAVAPPAQQAVIPPKP